MYTASINNIPNSLFIQKTDPITGPIANIPLP